MQSVLLNNGHESDDGLPRARSPQLNRVVPELYSHGWADDWTTPRYPTWESQLYIKHESYEFRELMYARPPVGLRNSKKIWHSQESSNVADVLKVDDGRTTDRIFDESDDESTEGQNEQFANNRPTMLFPSSGSFGEDNGDRCINELSSLSKCVDAASAADIRPLQERALRALPDVDRERIYPWIAASRDLVAHNITLAALQDVTDNSPPPQKPDLVPLEGVDQILRESQSSPLEGDEVDNINADGKWDPFMHPFKDLAKDKRQSSTVGLRFGAKLPEATAKPSPTACPPPSDESDSDRGSIGSLDRFLSAAPSLSWGSSTTLSSCRSVQTPADAYNISQIVSHKHSSPTPQGEMLPPPLGYKCDFPGCTSMPFPTQYLLSSHKNVHSSSRPLFCPVKDCPRSEGGIGFKRKNEMIRHGLVHRFPGYVCPFCPNEKHRYPRPDNLQRHVRVRHVDKDKDDPALRVVLAQRMDWHGKVRRKHQSTMLSETDSLDVYKGDERPESFCGSHISEDTYLKFPRQGLAQSKAKDRLPEPLENRPLQPFDATAGAHGSQQSFCNSDGAAQKDHVENHTLKPECKASTLGLGKGCYSDGECKSDGAPGLTFVGRKDIPGDTGLLLLQDNQEPSSIGEHPFERSGIVQNIQFEERSGADRGKQSEDGDGQVQGPCISNSYLPFDAEIQELKTRVSRLLWRTRQARTGSALSLNVQVNLQGSGPSPVYTPTQDLMSSANSNSPRISDGQEDFALCLETDVDPRLERNMRCASLPPEVGERSRMIPPLPNLSTANGRACSEPPLVEGRSISRFPIQVALAGESGTSNSGQVCYRGSGSSTNRQKRKHNDDGQDDDSNAQDNNDQGNHNGKRRCTTGPGSDRSSKGRLPCIFHAGEPRRWFDHTKRYKYLAELLRHLKAHDFYACWKCFTRVDNQTQLDRHHEQTPCCKSCQTKKCKRHRLQGTNPPEMCSHIITSEEQWAELFKVQYPGLEVPNVFEISSTMTDAAETQFDAFDLDSFAFAGSLESFSENTGQALETNNNIASLDTILETPSQGPASTPLGSGQAEGSGRNELQAIREYVRVAEERMEQWAPQPTGREEDLEVALGMVWQALVRCNSLEALPQSYLWRLVKRTAPDVLSSAPIASATTQQHPSILDDHFNTTLAPSALEWPLLTGDQEFEGSSQTFQSDSGYKG